MSNFIDRRLNPKGKSLANRQRFIRRARAEIKDAVQKSLKDRTVSDFAKDQKISIPTTLKEIKTFSWRRAGFTTSGSPNQINLVRTMRNSFGRRLAMHRPKEADIETLRERLLQLKCGATPNAENREAIQDLEEEIV